LISWYGPVISAAGSLGCRRSASPCGILAVLAVAALLAGCAGEQRAEPFAGYSRTPIRTVAAVSVPAVGGDGDDSFVAQPGGLRLVYFGFTSCPDVCPTTLSDLRRGLAELAPEERSRVGVDVVTVDPARDQPEVLDDYASSFIEDATSHRSDDPEVLRTAVDSFGANYRITVDSNGDPEVAHSGALYVVDDAGLVVLAWPFGIPAASIASDLERLLAGERPSDLSRSGGDHPQAE